jgi:hypothetical protein
MAGILSYFKNFRASELPLIVGVGFLSYVAPKILVELNRAWMTHQARKEGFTVGYRLNDDDDDGGGTRMQKTVDLCQRAVYF